MRFYIGKDIAGKIQVGKAGGEKLERRLQIYWENHK